MKNWLKKQYDDIKGNYKWALLVVLWAPMVAAVKKFLRMIPNMPGWAVWAILFLLSAIAFVWVAKFLKRDGQPTLSQTEAPVSLVTTTTKFDAPTYFRMAYQSPLTAEAEANIRRAAADNQPNDREGFYAKFIGVGLIGGWPRHPNKGCPTRRGFRRVGTASLNLLASRDDRPQSRMIKIAA